MKSHLIFPFKSSVLYDANWK